MRETTAGRQAECPRDAIGWRGYRPEVHRSIAKKRVIRKC